MKTTKELNEMKRNLQLQPLRSTLTTRLDHGPEDEQQLNIEHEIVQLQQQLETIELETDHYFDEWKAIEMEEKNERQDRWTNGQHALVFQHNDDSLDSEKLVRSQNLVGSREDWHVFIDQIQQTMMTLESRVGTEMEHSLGQDLYDEINGWFNETLATLSSMTAENQEQYSDGKVLDQLKSLMKQRQEQHIDHFVRSEKWRHLEEEIEIEPASNDPASASDDLEPFLALTLSCQLEQDKLKLVAKKVSDLSRELRLARESQQNLEITRRLILETEKDLELLVSKNQALWQLQQDQWDFSSDDSSKIGDNNNHHNSSTSSPINFPLEALRQLYPTYVQRLSTLLMPKRPTDQHSRIIPPVLLDASGCHSEAEFLYRFCLMDLTLRQEQMEANVEVLQECQLITPQDGPLLKLVEQQMSILPSSVNTEELEPKILVEKRAQVQACLSASADLYITQLPALELALDDWFRQPAQYATDTMRTKSTMREILAHFQKLTCSPCNP